MNWEAMTPLQRNALVAEKVMEWSWINFDYYDVTSVEHQLWLLPDAMATHDISPGEWVWYLDEKEVYPQGSVFPLPHKDNRILPAWLPHYAQKIDDAWDVIERVTMPPQTLEHAERAANTRFMLWWEKTPLWSHDRYEAAEAICKAALEAVGVELE